uniref:Fc of IgE receptor II n=1 Tax=Pipistrellus kuhlii TaxID=59472 RepID=A0A7J7U9T0_PIPKU|nr:Fc fragment of IgE receptor II [Pipistrellus kuhlii]
MEEGAYSDVLQFRRGRGRRPCCRRGTQIVLLGLVMATLWAGLLTLLLLWHRDAVQGLRQLGDIAARNVSQVSKDVERQKGDQRAQQTQGQEQLQAGQEQLQAGQKRMEIQDSDLSRNLDGLLEDLSNFKSQGLNERRAALDSLERLQEEVAKLRIEFRVSNGSACSTCPEQWVSFRRKCYYFGEGPKRWFQAREACRGLGGRLASIHSPEEQDFLAKHSSRKGTWIGLRDLDREGEFVWMDQSPLGYSNWGSGEPDNGAQGEDCVMLLSSGQWSDAFCGSYLTSWVCDRLATC